MKTKVFINNKFSYLDNFFRQLPENFSQIGEEIYIGRNDVRIINVDGLLLAVKFFKKMTLANRYIYATLRKSKATRAYEYTNILLERGITSPENVGYVNCYKYGMLCGAYYVSLYTDYKQFKDLINLPLSETEEAFKAFARFTYKLHMMGIYHNDYTIFNILYSVSDDKYDFSLIDNNRMTFQKYSFRKGMHNLKRLSVPVDILGIIAAEYAREANKNDFTTLNMIVFIRWGQLAKVAFKRWLKTPVRIITGKKTSSPVVINRKENSSD